MFIVMGIPYRTHYHAGMTQHGMTHHGTANHGITNHGMMYHGMNGTTHDIAQIWMALQVLSLWATVLAANAGGFRVRAFPFLYLGPLLLLNRCFFLNDCTILRWFLFRNHREPVRQFKSHSRNPSFFAVRVFRGVALSRGHPAVAGTNHWRMVCLGPHRGSIRSGS